MNTAISTAKIHFLGNCWVVIIGDRTWTVTNKTQLIDCLCGRPPDKMVMDELPYTETIEEFFARGGKITRIGRPEPKALPAPAPEVVKVAPSRLSLELLGLVRTKPK